MLGFRIAAPYLYPGLPQHLHLNYLLSRNVVTSLLKAQANAIYISIWKEDVYVTGNLIFQILIFLILERKSVFMIYENKYSQVC